MMREVRRKGVVQLRESAGAAYWECGVWTSTMNSDGVGISIAGCVEKMVREPNLMPFFFHFFSFFKYFVLSTTGNKDCMEY